MYRHNLLSGSGPDEIPLRPLVYCHEPRHIRPPETRNLPWISGSIDTIPSRRVTRDSSVTLECSSARNDPGIPQMSFEQGDVSRLLRAPDSRGGIFRFNVRE